MKLILIKQISNVLLILLFVVIGGFSLYQAVSLEGRVNYLSKNVSTRLRTAYKIESSILSMTSSIEKFIYLNKEEDDRDAEKKITEFQNVLNDALSRINEPEIVLTLNQISTLSESYITKYRNVVIRYYSRNESRRAIYVLGQGIQNELGRLTLQNKTIDIMRDRFVSSSLSVHEYMNEHNDEYSDIALKSLNSILSQPDNFNSDMQNLYYDIEDYRDHFEGFVLVTQKMEEEVHKTILPHAPRIIELANRIYSEAWEEMTSARITVEKEVDTTKRFVILITLFAMSLGVAVRYSSSILKKMHQAKSASEAASKIKSEFLANMSHEIRTPLNGIIGYSEIMLGADTIDTCHQQARIILDESNHLLGLINDILDQEKIKAGKLDLESIPVDIEELLETVVRMSSVKAKEKGLTLLSDISGNVNPYISGDPLRIRQILLNLVSNAIKFTEKGDVAITIKKLNGGPEPGSGKQTLEFSVKDTGIGISKDRQSTIFDSFTQADQSTTRKYGGTGLGTTISYQLVQLMGGVMTLESELGKGSTFSFVVDFDTVEKPDKKDREMQGDINECNGIRTVSGSILVAEDYPVNQQIVRNHLESAGHCVTVVENGKEALDACRKTEYDLILLDIQMPVMDGFETARQIRSGDSESRWAPIIALTANADLETKKKCLDAGMNDVLTKPIRRQSLFAGINNWLPRYDQPHDTTIEQPEQAQLKQNALSLPLDIESALNELDSVDSVKRIVRSLILTIDEKLGGMKLAVERGDMEMLRLEAHAIRGGAATIHAIPLSKAAHGLETACLEGEAESVPARYDMLVTEFECLIRYVNKNFEA